MVTCKKLNNCTPLKKVRPYILVLAESFSACAPVFILGIIK